MADDVAQLFHLDPNAGAYIASFGPKGSGKSELNTRFFISYPYNGMLLDFTGDIDPRHEFTTPLTPQLHRLASQLGDMKDPSLAAFDQFRIELREAWHAGAAQRTGQPAQFVKYRLEPSFLAKDWLEQSDNYVGLAYLMGLCFVFLDEIGEEAPVGRTPRFTRQSLRVGRHERLSMGMCGPRPADLDPNVLNQADIVTVHGQLHELDVQRMAKQLHIPTKELATAIDDLKSFDRADSPQPVHEYLAYVKRSRELFAMPPLPPREKSAA